MKEEGKQKKPRDLGERTIEYSLRAIKLYQFLQGQRDGAAKVIAKQYLRCATSIGANIEEGQHGESRADFLHKYGIAQKEARESIYWLRLLAQSGLVSPSKIGPLIEETQELLAILTRIIVKTKKGNKNDCRPDPNRD